MSITTLPTKLEILYEDKELILVNKPPMLLSQKSLDPKRLTVEEVLKNQRTDLQLFLHHRLDKETSGVFLFSKSKSVNGKLTEMFKQHDFHKTYWCLTYPNTLEPSKKVTCVNLNSESPLTDSNHWIIKNYMAPAKFEGGKGGKKRMISVKSGGWPAETEFRILKVFPKYFLVEAKPKTGRTHQIRQHLQESHRSIIGDDLYCGGRANLAPRFLLHAYELEFPHPSTGKKINVTAPLPKDFQSLIEI